MFESPDGASEALAVRAMTAAEMTGMVEYFHGGDVDFLQGMGVDPSKLPCREEWLATLRDDLSRPKEERQFYYLLWEADGQPVGHSNINEIRFGQDAFMHLHLWRPDRRRRGLGTFFVQRSVEAYFEQFELGRLFCRPFAGNPAPNRLLARMGFEFVKEYETCPGRICFHQPVKLWVMERPE